MSASASALSSQSFSREPSMNRDLFQEIATMMEKTTGILFPDSKSSLVQARVSKRMAALNISGFREYMDFLATPDGQAEHEELVFTLTTNLTRFYREPHHFEDLKENVLPGLISKAHSGERVRIWSAGCSSGEEPYSIALMALAADPNLGLKDFKILATDLDRNMIRKGKAGKYPVTGAQSAPEQFRGLLPKSGDTVDMPDKAKQLITFRELNLLHDWPLRGPFDVIFCRNVVIYFREELSEKLWQKFAGLLQPGGRLYSGHSERIRSPEAYRLKPYGITSYEKL